MNILIEGYRNIEKLDYSIVNNKINVLFGVSGSGKSSISKALNLVDCEYNKKVDFRGSEQVIYLDGKTPNVEKIRTFDFNCENNYIFTSNNDDVFDILVDNNKEFIKIQNKFEENIRFLANDLDNIYDSYIALREMTSIFAGKLTNDNKLKKNSKAVKMRLSFENSNNSRVLKHMNEIPENKLDWVFKGIDLIDENQCPFCNKLLSKKVLSRFESFSKFESKNFNLLRNNKQNLEKSKITSIQYNATGINKLCSQINKAAIAVKEFEKITNIMDILSKGTFNFNEIKCIEVSEETYTFFPSLRAHIKKFNLNLDAIKNKAYKARGDTAKLLNKRTRQINSIISSMNIPYEIIATYHKSKITDYRLHLKTDEKDTDRKKSLSDGEKNLICLLLFILECEKNDTYLVIIDDPVSSYDEFRRKIIFDLISDKLKNKTVLILSHDSVFAKFGVLSKKNNIGNIAYLENLEDEVSISKISREDFKDFNEYLLENIKNSNDYYRKIISMRILYEGKNRALEYGYLSAVLHIISNDNLKKLLEEKGQDEESILLKINERYKIKLTKFDDTFYKDIKCDDYSLLEKALLIRELKRNSDDERLKSINKEELSNLIHANDRLSICLSPFKFSFCSNSTLNSINKLNLNEIISDILISVQ